MSFLSDFRAFHSNWRKAGFVPASSMCRPCRGSLLLSHFPTTSVVGYGIPSLRDSRQDAIARGNECRMQCFVFRVRARFRLL